jgi:hypothetical protein
MRYHTLQRPGGFVKLVIFAGAGFSAPFGLPVMNNFLGFADASDRLTEDDKALLGRLVLEARRANSFLESSPTNLEDILSFSEMGDRLGLAPSDEKRSERVRGIVERVFTSARLSDHYWSQFDNLRRIVDHPAGNAPSSVSFITTNYDLNIEIACHRAGWAATLSTPIQRFTEGWTPVAGRLYSDTGVPIYKLHGSVNWYPSADKPGSLLVNDFVVPVSGGHLFPHVCTSEYRPPWAPIIVPPSFLKPELVTPLRAAWAGAARALSEASVVAFIGYSFPPSDTEMMYFLARALSENSSLRRILIIDPHAAEITQRLRSTSSKSGSHFRDLIQVVADKWEMLPNTLLATMR